MNKPITLPDSMPVTFESRRLFELAFRNTPPSVSDLVFSNLYGWQEHFGYRVSCFEDLVAVHYTEGREMKVFPPLLLKGSITDPGFANAFLDLAAALKQYAAEQGRTLSFRSFPDFYLAGLPAVRFKATPERDSFDYVYGRTELAELQGKIYAPKRNLIRQFERKYPYRFEPLTKDNAGRVAEFALEWKKRQGLGGEKDLSSGEPAMVRRLAEKFEYLKLTGGLLFVGDVLVAATLAAVVPDFHYGSETAPTAVVHSEHALVEYKGSYQMINRELARYLPQSVKYINREEDLGIEGLRTAKLSYHPVLLLRKNRVVMTP